LVLPLLAFPTSAAKFLTPKLVRILSDLFHSFLLAKQYQFHLLVVVVLPLIGEETENFGITEGFCGE